MKKFCSFLTILVIVVIGIGFYRGWFAVSGGRDAESNDVDVSLTVDTYKVKADTGLAREDTQNPK